MNTKAIRKQIKKAAKIEEETGNLYSELRNYFSQRGITNKKELSATFEFLNSYIKHVPELLDLIYQRANEHGILNYIQPIIEYAEQYFFIAEDLIPDHYGLLGLLDDAYLAHCLMQGLSDKYQRQTGQTLLPNDMTNANRVVRVLLGDINGNILDASVMNLINGPSIEQTLNALLSNYNMFNVSGPDPIWGNASISEIAETRLGAMGVI
jgi:uncharacterized membrane protein YkvA (DUF1232 family)